MLREAEWLHSLDANPESYLPLIESAIALGVPIEDTITLHLDGFLQQFSMFRWQRSWMTAGAPTTKFQDLGPLFNYPSFTLPTSDKAAHLLPLARQLLHQTSWYLEHGGRDYFEGNIDPEHLFKTYKSNEIWYSIQALCHIRTIIYRKMLPKGYGNEFELFELGEVAGDRGTEIDLAGFGEMEDGGA